jgi:hypothetical protein
MQRIFNQKILFLKLFTISLITFLLYDTGERIYLAITDDRKSDMLLFVTSTLNLVEIFVLIKFVLSRILTPSRKALLIIGALKLALLLLVLDLLIKTPLITVREILIITGLLAFGSLKYKKYSENTK